MLVLGIDLGNGNIKGISGDSKFFIPSTLIEGSNKLDDTSIGIEYNGKSYILGKMQGDRQRDYAKYKTEHHKIMLLAAIGSMMQTNKEEVYLVVGTPIKYFMNHGKKYRDIVMSYTEDGPVKIKVNGVEKEISIKGCIALPQGALPFGNTDLDGYSLVIDIGSGTTDVSYWDKRTLVKAESYNVGCTDLYNQISEKVNKMNDEFNVEPFLIERQLVKNPKLESIKILGGKVDIKAIVNDAIDSVTGNITSKISQDFSNLAVIDDVCIVGGGSIYFEDSLKKTYKFAQVNKDVFFNAAIYYRIGVETFGNN